MSVGSLLGFVFSPAGRVAAILLALWGWTVYQRQDAAAAATARVEARLEAEWRSKVVAAERVASEARARADETAEDLETLKGLRDEAASSGGQCRLSDDQLRKLRAIR